MVEAMEEKQYQFQKTRSLREAAGRKWNLKPFLKTRQDLIGQDRERRRVGGKSLGCSWGQEEKGLMCTCLRNGKKLDSEDWGKSHES